MKAAALARLAAVVVIVVTLLAPILMPVFTGHRLIVVDGGSMAPTFLVGDVLLTAAPTDDDLEVGSVVVVGTPGSLYTHRVIEVDRSAPEPRARLQGDANATPDPNWVPQSDIYAVYLAHVGGATAWIVRAVTTMPGTLILLGIAVVLLLTGARSETPRRSHSSPRSQPQPDLPAAPGP